MTCRRGRGRFKYYANDAVERAAKGSRAIVEKGMIQITHETRFRDTIVSGQRVLECVAGSQTLVAYPDDVRFIGRARRAWRALRRVPGADAVRSHAQSGWRSSRRRRAC